MRSALHRRRIAFAVEPREHVACAILLHVQPAVARPARETLARSAFGGAEQRAIDSLERRAERREFRQPLVQPHTRAATAASSCARYAARTGASMNEASKLLRASVSRALGGSSSAAATAARLSPA